MLETLACLKTSRRGLEKFIFFPGMRGGGGSAQFQANNRGISSAQINNQKEEDEIDLRRFWQFFESKMV